MKVYKKFILLTLLNLSFIIFFDSCSPNVPLLPEDPGASEHKDSKSINQLRNLGLLLSLLKPKPDLEYRVSCNVSNKNQCSNYYLVSNTRTCTPSDPSIIQLNTFCSPQNVVGVCFAIDKNYSTLNQVAFYSPTYTTASASAECLRDTSSSTRFFFTQNYATKQSYSVAEIDALR